MDQRDEGGENGRFLPAVDSGGARKDAGRFILELALEPQATRRIDELLHLGAHIAIAGRSLISCVMSCGVERPN
jgi:hypothetical protein